MPTASVTQPACDATSPEVAHAEAAHVESEAPGWLALNKGPEHAHTDTPPAEEVPEPEPASPVPAVPG